MTCHDGIAMKTRKGNQLQDETDVEVITFRTRNLYSIELHTLLLRAPK